MEVYKVGPSLLNVDISIVLQRGLCLPLKYFTAELSKYSASSDLGPPEIEFVFKYKDTQCRTHIDNSVLGVGSIVWLSSTDPQIRKNTAYKVNAYIEGCITVMSWTGIEIRFSTSSHLGPGL